MTLPADALDALKAFKDNLPKPVVTKKLRRLKAEGPSVVHEAKPKEPDPNVRRNGPKSWLVMAKQPQAYPGQATAYSGLKSREDPVVRDAPITKALERKASDVSGNTAQICNDASIFKRTR